SFVKVFVGSIISVRPRSLGAICWTFSSNVIRESKSATRSSIARFEFWYLGAAFVEVVFSCEAVAAQSTTEIRQENRKLRRAFGIDRGILFSRSSKAV